MTPFGPNDESIGEVNLQEDSQEDREQMDAQELILSELVIKGLHRCLWSSCVDFVDPGHDFLVVSCT